MMPALSQDLPGPRHPALCQACGAGPEVKLLRWRECTVTDAPTDTVIVLCQPCSDRIIDPHPRLYHPLDEWEPAPGCMELCISCRHREGTECRHPDRTRYGGPGLAITFPRPIQAHLYFGGGKGAFHTQWTGPVKSCAGREELAEAEKAGTA